MRDSMCRLAGVAGAFALLATPLPASAQVISDPDDALDCALAVFTPLTRQAQQSGEEVDVEAVTMFLTYFAGRHDSLSSESFGEGLNARGREIDLSKLDRLVGPCLDEFGTYSQSLDAADEVMYGIEDRLTKGQ